MKSGGVRVYMPCSGLGRISRGFETFTRECADALNSHPEVEITVFKGAGPNSSFEKRVPSISREHRLLQWLSARSRFDSYTSEQLAFFPGLLAHLLLRRPDVIYLSDFVLARLCRRWRGLTNASWKILFCNGGPSDQPLDWCDMVHHPSPVQRRHALEAGGDPDRHVALPYGLNIPKADVRVNAQGRRALRVRLNLPPERTLILTVGAVNASHKRMDYVIREVAQSGDTRPYLLILGQHDDETSGIEAEALRLLGAGNFNIRTIRKSEMLDYYLAADLFTLASLSEGFGLAYVEALSWGLRCLAHDSELTRYILQEHGYLADFSSPGGLSNLITQLLPQQDDPAASANRHAAAYARFSWDVLGSSYVDMLLRCHRQESAPLQQNAVQVVATSRAVR